MNDLLIENDQKELDFELQLTDNKLLIQNLFNEEKELNKKKNELEESKRTKWREEGELTRNLESIKEKSRSAERTLMQMMDKVIYSKF